MGVDEEIRVELLEDGRKTMGVAGIGFDEVAIEIKITGIATKALLFGTRLVALRLSAPPML